MNIVSVSLAHQFAAIHYRWSFVDSVSHPADGAGRRQKNNKRKARLQVPSCPSPESVRLRGPKSRDPQRLNPAP